MIAFAATGHGQVESLVGTDPRRSQLTVTGAVALIYVDRETQTIRVGRVLNRRY